MANIFDYLGNYLKAEDLQGRDALVTISHVAIETMKDQKGVGEQKPVIYFVGKQKGLVLNITNAKRIAVNHGDDYTFWANAQITLGTEMVDSFGEIKPAIRVRIEQPVAAQTAPASAAPPVHAPPPATAPGGGDIDDEIPFAAEWR